MNQVLAAVAAAVLGSTAIPAMAGQGDRSGTIVLVHGAFVDGSGWAEVHRMLSRDGYKVVVVQNPTTSLGEDVAATRRAIAAAEGKVVLVGHSYGGVVITEAGSDPKVSALVYVAAFAPDQGESVASIIAQAPPGAPALPILPSVDGFLLLDRGKFPAVFAADVAPEVARFMADSQQPWGAQALEGKITAAAWRTKPSWYLVAKDDHVIPPPAQRMMARRAGASVRDVAASHAVYVSQPGVVASLIEEAASRSAAKAER